MANITLTGGNTPLVGQPNLYRVRMKDHFLRIYPSGRAENVGGMDSMPPQSVTDYWSLMNLDKEQIAWTFTKSLADNLIRELWAFGVAINLEKIGDPV